MDCREVPTLLNFAAVKVAASFYNDYEVRELAKLVNSEDLNEEWKQMLYDKASLLDLPTHLRDTVGAVASRVCLCIRDKNIKFHEMHWKISSIFNRHCQCLKGVLPGSYQWAWRSNFYIHDPGTVQELVRDMRVDLAFRFSLSCDYMLGNEAASIWNQMPMAMQNRFLEGDLKYAVGNWIVKFLEIGGIECPDDLYLAVVAEPSGEFLERQIFGEFADGAFRMIGKQWRCVEDIPRTMHRVPWMLSTNKFIWGLDTEIQAECLLHLDNDLGFTH